VGHDERRCESREGVKFPRQEGHSPKRQSRREKKIASGQTTGKEIPFLGKKSAQLLMEVEAARGDRSTLTKKRRGGS